MVVFPDPFSRIFELCKGLGQIISDMKRSGRQRYLNVSLIFFLFGFLGNWLLKGLALQSGI